MDTPNSVRPEIGIYVGDQEPGPAQEIGKKRGKAHVNVGEIAREAGEKEVDVGCRRNRPKEAVLCGHRT